MNSIRIKKVLTLVFFIAFNGCSKEKKQPNIIIILTDDQGYGDLSCYGAEKFDTPNKIKWLVKVFYLLIFMFLKPFAVLQEPH